MFGFSVPNTPSKEARHATCTRICDAYARTLRDDDGSDVRQFDDRGHRLGVRGRRTATRTILAADGAAEKHYQSYYRLFSAARWSLNRLGLAVFALVEPWLSGEILLGLDDTLCRKRGLKVFGAGMLGLPP